MSDDNGGPWGGGGSGGNNGKNNGNKNGGNNRQPDGPQIPEIDELMRKGQERLRVLMGGKAAVETPLVKVAEGCRAARSFLGVLQRLLFGFLHHFTR